MTYEKVKEKFGQWMELWNNHDLDGVLEWMDAQVVFEHWTGSVISGKELLIRAWKPWFSKHGGFYFATEDFFFDENDQKLTFLWILNWPSRQKGFEGLTEIRRGIDVIYLRDEKIIRKVSYSKTSVNINNKPVKDWQCENHLK